MHTLSHSQVFLRAGGQDLQDKFSALGGLAPWTVAYTHPAGSLNCNTLCHLSIREWTGADPMKVMYTGDSLIFHTIIHQPPLIPPSHSTHSSLKSSKACFFIDVLYHYCGFLHYRGHWTAGRQVRRAILHHRHDS